MNKDGAVGKSDTPLVSVVVPVYNVERYLDRCVTSIINQTYRNLDIILVDDGSPDRCPEICDGWARKDDRITVIHKENGGLSSARNAALPVARGAYLAFVDSDDFVDSDFIEEGVRVARRDDAQIVFFPTSNDVFDQDGAAVSSSVQGSMEFTARTRDEFIQHFSGLSDSQYVCPVWNKLFLTDFALQHGHHFDESVRVGEDSLFNFPLYARANRVSATTASKYHYCIRVQGGNLMSTYKPRLLKDRVFIHQQLLPTIRQWNMGYMNDHNNRLMANVWIMLSLLYADRTAAIRAQRGVLAKDILSNEVVRACARAVRPVHLQQRIVVALVHYQSVLLTGLTMRSMAALRKLKERR